MSFQAMTWAVEQALACKEKMVLLMLANHCNSHNGQCNPSINRLADECGLGRDSVLRAIKSLEEGDYLSIDRRKIGEVNLPNQYVLNLSRGSSSLQGVVAESDKGSSTQRLGVVAESDSNQEYKPVIETNKLTSVSLYAAPQKEKKSMQQNDLMVLLLSFGFSEQLAHDFIAHRKAKKAPISKTVVEGFIREAGKAGITVVDAVTSSIEQGWTGFRADWFVRLNSNSNSGGSYGRNSTGSRQRGPSRSAVTSMDF